MSAQLLSPAGLTQPVPYHHVAVGTGSKIVTVAGQVGGSIGPRSSTPGDLGTQVAGALRNVAVALAGAGASFCDVTRLTFYVTDWKAALMEEFLEAVDSVREELRIPLPMPPASLIGVQELFEPGVLVEVEATAVID